LNLTLLFKRIDHILYVIMNNENNLYAEEIIISGLQLFTLFKLTNKIYFGFWKTRALQTLWNTDWQTDLTGAELLVLWRKSNIIRSYCWHIWPYCFNMRSVCGDEFAKDCFSPTALIPSRIVDYFQVNATEKRAEHINVYV